MASESKETWFLDIVEKLDDFCKRVDEKIEKEQQQMKACKKKTELETKLAQEMKLHNELTERLAELVRRGSELDRVCATFESHLSIADSDRNRLDNANESRKLLQPIELDMSTGADSGALWALLQTTAAPGWPFQGDKENRPCNEVK
ncbi:hypothetical protein SFRURICE_011093 [Spodoptera frugiperda]|nr:hypothetical protein SFRURICE_011093 [Spodoptera frugiperda]